MRNLNELNIYRVRFTRVKSSFFSTQSVNGTSIALTQINLSFFKFICIGSDNASISKQNNIPPVSKGRVHVSSYDYLAVDLLPW